MKNKKDLMQTVAIVILTIGGLIMTSPQDKLWKTAFGVAIAAISLPFFKASEPESTKQTTK